MPRQLGNIEVLALNFWLVLPGQKRRARQITKGLQVGLGLALALSGIVYVEVRSKGSSPPDRGRYDGQGR